MNNMAIYDWDDAVNFIAERSNLDFCVIEEVLTLEEDYMRSVGIITDEQIE